MNKLILAAFLASVSSGCILYSEGHDDGYGHEGPLYSGEVTFSWRFAGQLCHEVPEVQGIHISIPGESLQNDGYYPCTANGFAGIVLHDFAGGHYDFSLTALDYADQPLYVADGSFTVDGDVRVNVDLTPAGAPSSYGFLSWRFPANSESNFPNCEQAGVNFVDVRIDGAKAVRYSCTAGFGSAAVQTDYLEPGSHRIELTALSEDGYPYYSYSGSLVTWSGSPASSEYSLDWAVGGVALEWKLFAGTEKTCSTAGVQNMSINFQDQDGNLVYGASGDSQACDSAPIVYNYLLPGVYRVFIQGTGPGGTYLSDAQHPITVQVRAGDFVTEAEAAIVNLYKQ